MDILTETLNFCGFLLNWSRLSASSSRYTLNTKQFAANWEFAFLGPSKTKTIALNGKWKPSQHSKSTTDPNPAYGSR